MKILLVFLSLFMGLNAKDYTKKTDVKKFMKSLTKEYKIEKMYLTKLFAKVKVSQSALKAFRPRPKIHRTPAQLEALKRRYPKHGAWDRYSKYKVTPLRVKQGVAFLKKYIDIFEKVEKEFGVPKEYIVSIIGIETVFGRNVGKYPIFDTLTTLAFEKNRRNTFFRKQLKEFIRLAYTQKFNPKDVYGSYAGAIGLCQFMPSNYKAYGVDFNKDGKITLQRAGDAIASVANYFRKNGWRVGEPVATQVSYAGNRFKAYKTGYTTTYNRKDLKGIAPKKYWAYNKKVRLIKLDKKEYDELWYGAKNFFVITRYNHSAYYAMSVHKLAMQIKAKLYEN